MELVSTRARRKIKQADSEQLIPAQDRLVYTPE
jgi:hypothetical protein